MTRSRSSRGLEDDARVALERHETLARGPAPA